MSRERVLWSRRLLTCVLTSAEAIGAAGCGKAGWQQLQPVMRVVRQQRAGNTRMVAVKGRGLL